jgi:hypothetical protein
MWFPRLARNKLVLLTAFAVVALATAGGLAYAAIPDSSGVIHGCYAKNNGQLRVVDTDAGGKCIVGEKSLNWNQTGPQGATGPRGPSDAYYARGGDARILRFRDGGTPLAALDLPAGDYAVTAKVEFNDNFGEFLDLTCDLVSAGTTADFGQMFESAPGTLAHGISLLAAVSGPAKVGVNCYTFDATGARALASAILATQVGTIHQQ